jgi:hypothetical protein
MSQLSQYAECRYAECHGAQTTFRFSPVNFCASSYLLLKTENAESDNVYFFLKSSDGALTNFPARIKTQHSRGILRGCVLVLVNVYIEIG